MLTETQKKLKRAMEEELKEAATDEEIKQLEKNLSDYFNLLLKIDRRIAINKGKYEKQRQ